VGWWEQELQTGETNIATKRTDNQFSLEIQPRTQSVCDRWDDASRRQPEASDLEKACLLADLEGAALSTPLGKIQRRRRAALQVAALIHASYGKTS
jgi:hypothetical protein